ncbi:high frequency lysogenization protein HflD [Aestuariicella hydrocarbonica]|uniref:High frequency lysogenization protein HflD homolog n=1 Tax=Pseudomaricurvus hydrocarbonicus TaxID=1470433 RepID=A0A9E5JTG9_9GAMM|nr:high frequency lysogenization protein HflD [Aestuariicella hydrocarbonica]NHO65278.1 high frequency lysogenization protein HflD [Aestuariicella hydrocarbonica]
MSKNWNDITLAMAGVFQAAGLVEQLAKTGYVPADAQRASLQTLFVQNPQSTLDVYGGHINHVELGLKIMSDLLHHHQNRDYPDTLRYVLGILHLQKKMMGRKDMLEVIGKRLEQSQRQAEHFDITHENVLSGLGGLYGDTISTFKFRIQVMGDFSYLQQTRVANQVRALLLAGIRSATLWRQVGGTRFQVVLQRKKLSQCADQLLKQLN